MSEQAFADRVARLEEHLVTTPMTSGDYLARAERLLGEGRPLAADCWLDLAKIARMREEFEDDA